MARSLVAAGHKVTVVCGVVDTADTGVPATGKRITHGEVDGFSVLKLDFPYSNKHSLKKRAWNFARYSVAASRIALTYDYDLLFATSTPLTAAIPGIATRLTRRKKPFVFEVRDVWPDLPIALGGLSNPVAIRALKLLEKLAYNCSHRTIGLAPGICELIDQRRSRGSGQSALIPNGSDLELFIPQPDRVAGSPLRAVFTGTHGSANGLDAVLSCAQILKDRGRTDIEIHMIGDGREKEALQQRAASQRLTNCAFHPSMPKVELAKLLPTFDVGLMTLANLPEFYYGTSPNKFFDYIASGLPVINNYPGWLAGLIQEHDCGIAVEPEAPQVFADALEKLADEPELCRRYSANARNLAEDEFGREDLASRFATTLEGALTDFWESKQR